MERGKQNIWQVTCCVLCQWGSAVEYSCHAAAFSTAEFMSEDVPFAFRI